MRLRDRRLAALTLERCCCSGRAQPALARIEREVEQDEGLLTEAIGQILREREERGWGGWNEQGWG